jgi:hypothetical protein
MVNNITKHMVIWAIWTAPVSNPEHKDDKNRGQW